MTCCPSCQSDDLITLNTYKRTWFLCHACGDAFPQQKDRYSLTFLSDPHLKKMPEDEASMYDYFIQQDHIDYSIATAGDFLRQHAEPNRIAFYGKRVLDISGGNGHFLMEIAKLGAEVTLTEINQPTIDYAKATHGIDVHLFNFNSHSIQAEVPKTFGIVMARAAIMFCQNLAKFAQDTREILADDGLVIVNHSVIPTLGVMLRVQLDEFSYFRLRQPESVIRTFEKAGYILQSRADETDPSLYVYDHDMNRYWTLARYLHEQPAMRRLVSAERSGKACYAFRARDRRRSTIIFRKLPNA